MLEVTGLRLALPDFTRRRPIGPRPKVEILKGVDLSLAEGEALGIVGESGSGKTSLGRTLLRLYRPTGGRILFEGQDITRLPEKALRPLRARFQIIFQDPQSALNPRKRIGDIVGQPLLAFGRVRSREEAWTRARALLERVSLSAEHADRYPHELSGGQRQRVGIARAIALDPVLVVADEIVSGLDVSSQAQILALLRELRAELGLALIFISHDLSVVRTVCDRVMVMLAGEIVERGPCETIFTNPQHPYTRKLLDAVPLPDVDPEWIDRAPLDDDDGQDEATKHRERKMQVKGSIALVTGANRGIGEQYVKALLERGAAKIYAAARDPASLDGVVKQANGKIEALKIDITNDADIAAAAKKCKDVNLLINNAGVNFNTPLVGIKSLDNARVEMNTNYFGTLAMCRAFAPVLKANGGGTIVNMLSILARVNLPLMGSLCASKAAALSMTQGVRAELAAQGTKVIAVMPGAVDTRMTEILPPPKMAPAEVASAVMNAIDEGIEEVYPGDMAQGVAAGLASDPKAVEKQFAGYLPQ
ncbi:MAG TPA: SDR family oxidoreductase [Alphaproteobacteria bacterium]